MLIIIEQKQNTIIPHTLKKEAWKLMQTNLKTCMLKPITKMQEKNHTRHIANKLFQNMAKVKRL
jgi:BarA-like signal transduction histidine kinase